MNQGRGDKPRAEYTIVKWSVVFLVVGFLILFLSSCTGYKNYVRADMAQEILRNTDIKMNEAGLIYLDSITFYLK